MTREIGSAREERNNMAKSVNKVILIGNLGKDPELKHTSGGTAVANFTLATNERFKDKDGNWQDKTEWHNITCWARLAEIASEYLKKGRSVYVEGRLQTRSWEDKQRTKRYTTEIVASDLVLLGAAEAATRVAPAAAFLAWQRLRSERPWGVWQLSHPATEITDDDIPF